MNVNQKINKRNQKTKDQRSILRKNDLGFEGFENSPLVERERVFIFLSSLLGHYLYIVVLIFGTLFFN